MNRKAIVAGATGLIGKEVVQLLLESPEYKEVMILVRRTTGIKHPKLIEKIIDFDQLERQSLDFEGTDVFCTLGTTIKKAGSQEAFRRVDYSYPLALGKIAKEQGARQYLIVSSMGANPNAKAFYTRVKGDIEKALTELGLPSFSIFRPSLLLGEREEFRLGEKMASVISTGIPVLFKGPLRKYRPIYGRTVAKALVGTAIKEVQGVHIYESEQIQKLGESRQ